MINIKHVLTVSWARTRADMLAVICRKLDPMPSSSSQTNPLERTTSPSATAPQGPALASSPALSATALESATASRASALGLTALAATALQGEVQEPYQPNLSKHERQLMQQAHERHQASIISKQVCLQYCLQARHHLQALLTTCSIVHITGFSIES